jgi:hypothetical protein
VNGPVLDNYERVVLSGQAPKIGTDCQIRGHVLDTLEFKLLKPGSVAATTTITTEPQPATLRSLLSALIGTWMPISETEPTQFNTYKFRVEKNNNVVMTGIESLCTYSNFEVTPYGQLKADADCGETIHASTGRSTFAFISGGTKGNLLIIADAFKKTVNTNDDIVRKRTMNTPGFKPSSRLASRSVPTIATGSLGQRQDEQ